MALILGAALSVGNVLDTAGPSPFEATPTELTLQSDGAPVFVYRHDEVPRKPYLKEWYSPKGLNVLRDAPADHLHHHGLMFAIKVDGVNFWEEWDTGGYQVHGAFTKLRHDPDSHAAGFASKLVWHDADSPEPLLFEHRAIRHSPLSSDDVRVLTWQSDLQAPADGEGVSLEGNLYHGLGMRFPAFMDRVGEFVMAADKSGAFDDGPNHRLARAAWCAYRVEHGEHPVTVAMFHCPDNPRPTLWFTMREPFAYLSATQDLLRAPMELEAGAVVSFRHGLAVWDRVVEELEIDAMHRAWLESLR